MYDWWVPLLTAHPSSVHQTQLRRGPQSYPQGREVNLAKSHRGNIASVSHSYQMVFVKNY